MLVRRLELLSEVERLARSLQLPEDVGYTCETAGYFWLLHVYSRWEQFLAACADNEGKPTFVRDRFPFKEFFSNTPQPIFTGDSFEKDMRAAKGCFLHLQTLFQELEECRAFELLKSTADRANYLMTKQAKIVAMTCTHAALKRKDFLQLGFKYDNLLMEESAQILEIETFIPMLLQRQEDGYARLKRCILIGDHHQLPPVVKNMAFQKYSHMDQSLFTRFVRLGIPYIELNAQGRARPSIAQLYNWRYRDLGDLPFVKEEPFFHRANAGFSYDYQLVDVPDYNGRGESAPSPWFYQNEGEAEYVVSVYIYMRLLGYPANKISILTTYNGQKLLIRDVINRQCVPYPFIGPPSKVSFHLGFVNQWRHCKIVVVHILCLLCYIRSQIAVTLCFIFVCITGFLYACFRSLRLINFKVSKMISFCCLLCVLDLWVTFVMLEDWLLLCPVLGLVCMSFVDVLCLNNAMSCSLLFGFCFRDLINLHLP